MNKKNHWEKVYTTKSIAEVSWYQPIPEISLNFLQEFNIPLNASIIDVGGGDSLFADHLLALGYTNVTVLDISETAIKKAKQRLGSKAALINWVISDVLTYVPDRKFGFWHDRATFHFFTEEEQVRKYFSIAKEAIDFSGRMVIGAFSEHGPEKCSNLPVKKYSEGSISIIIKGIFKKIKCFHTEHITPFNSIQQFLFCSFKKLPI
jgi:ubiquinone/menaquinone biosynthesis C-methylase UbiE